MAGPAVADPGLNRAHRGLDWLNFFTANLQTAFGPFIAVYLTERAWTENEIGFALSVGSIAGMAAQLPAGALVDAARRKAKAAGAAIIAIIAGAVTLAAAPMMLPVLAAEVSHAFASCMLTPAIAAISLELAGTGPGAAGERLGRNARFASIGNGVAAGLMAVVGYELAARAVFYLGAILAVPGLFALRLVPDEVAPGRASQQKTPLLQSILASFGGGLPALLADRRLLWFALCCALFHLSNGFMLPLAASAATASLGAQTATLVTGACIVGPQIVVALCSPAVGRRAEERGRRQVLALGMLALPLRGLLLALIAENPALPGWLLVPVQLLDGVSGAVFGVMLPLIAADIARGSGRFNLCMGLLGLAVGGAASASSLAGGWIAERSMPLAFAALAGCGAVGALAAWLMPETRFSPGTHDREGG